MVNIGKNIIAGNDLGNGGAFHHLIAAKTKVRIHKTAFIDPGASPDPQLFGDQV